MQSHILSRGTLLGSTIARDIAFGLLGRFRGVIVSAYSRPLGASRYAQQINFL